MHSWKKLLLAAAVLAAGFNSANAENAKLSIGYVNGWDDSVAVTHVAAEILQSKLGHSVELKPVEPAIMWQGVARGDLDATLSAWMPGTHGEYYERLKDKVEVLGTNYADAKIGLIVPSYVQATSISDLQSQAKDYDGKITGIDAGAGVVRRAEDAIKEYELTNIKMMTSSGPGMATALARAIKAEQPIVVTGWIPHWMFAQWDLRFLDDPKLVFGAAERIDTVANPALKEKAPQAAKFLSNLSWGPADVGSVMLAIRDGVKPEQAAKDWVAANPEMVDNWLK